MPESILQVMPIFDFQGPSSIFDAFSFPLNKSAMVSPFSKELCLFLKPEKERKWNILEMNLDVWNMINSFNSLEIVKLRNPTQPLIVMKPFWLSLSEPPAMPHLIATSPMDGPPGHHGHGRPFYNPALQPLAQQQSMQGVEALHGKLDRPSSLGSVIGIHPSQNVQSIPAQVGKESILGSFKKVESSSKFCLPNHKFKLESSNCTLLNDWQLRFLHWNLIKS